MSFQRIIATAIRDAGIAEANFDAAIKAEGFKSRFDWFLRGGPPSLQEAYNLKVAADKAMHEYLQAARAA
jgi:hypothetical protein